LIDVIEVISEIKAATVREFLQGRVNRFRKERRRSRPVSRENLNCRIQAFFKSVYFFKNQIRLRQFKNLLCGNFSQNIEIRSGIADGFFRFSNQANFDIGACATKYAPERAVAALLPLRKEQKPLIDNRAPSRCVITRAAACAAFPLKNRWNPVYFRCQAVDFAHLFDRQNFLHISTICHKREFSTNRDEKPQNVISG
jgi:hypothetical protein